jgi:hypothetical protein
LVGCACFGVSDLKNIAGALSLAGVNRAFASSLFVVWVCGICS